METIQIVMLAEDSFDVVDGWDANGRSLEGVILETGPS
jgi:hypothetical protein